MSEEGKPKDGEGQSAQDPNTQTQDPNWRQETFDNPIFKSMKAQLAEYEAKFKQAEEEKLQAEEAAKRKKAEEEGNYKQIISDMDAKFKDAQKQFEAQLKDRDLRLDLANAGFSARGIDLLSKEYDGTTELADYVKACVDNKDNAVFLKQQEGAGIPPNPIGNPSSQTNNISRLKAELNDPKTARAASQRLQEILLSGGSID